MRVQNAAQHQFTAGVDEFNFHAMKFRMGSSRVEDEMRMILLRWFWFDDVGIESAHNVTFHFIRRAKINFPGNIIADRLSKFDPHGVSGCRLLRRLALSVLPTQQDCGSARRVSRRRRLIFPNRLSIGSGRK